MNKKYIVTLQNRFIYLFIDIINCGGGGGGGLLDPMAYNTTLP